jgi:hypothetical protein
MARTTSGYELLRRKYQSLKKRLATVENVRSITSLKKRLATVEKEKALQVSLLKQERAKRRLQKAEISAKTASAEISAVEQMLAKERASLEMIEQELYAQSIREGLMMDELKTIKFAVQHIASATAMSSFRQK